MTHRKRKGAPRSSWSLPIHNRSAEHVDLAFSSYTRTFNRLEVNRKTPEDTLTKDKLIEIIRGLLQARVELGFLLKLDQVELETLVACIRDRVDRARK